MRLFFKIIISIMAIENGLFAKEFSDIPLFYQGLREAEKSAIDHSESLKAISASLLSTQFQEKAIKALTYPNISLQAAYLYQTEVPSKTLGPLGSISFGTHNNYAIGPVFSYTLFDNNKESKNAESFNLLTQSKNAHYLAQKKLIELNLRQVYFQVQFALSELILTAKSLKISEAEKRDVDLRFRAGASSRLDQIQAHREILSYHLKYRQAQTQLASYLQELIALTGVGQELNTAKSVPNILLSDMPEGVETPTVRVSLDSLESTLEKISPTQDSYKKFSAPTEEHFEMQVFTHEAASSRMASESEKAGVWPKVQLQAKSQYIYPDVVIPKNIIQNTIGVTLSVPFYEGDASKSRSALKLNEALSSEFLKKQKLSDLTRDFIRARDSISSLLMQRSVSLQSVQDARMVESLTFQSYKNGKIRYLDVQDANLKLLEAEVSYAQIQSKILMETAVLSYLSSLDL